MSLKEPLRDFVRGIKLSAAWVSFLAALILTYLLGPYPGGLKSFLLYLVLLWVFTHIVYVSGIERGKSGPVDETSEMNEIVKFMSATYLYRKSRGVWPNKEEINKEKERRMRRIKSVNDKYQGEEAALKVRNEIYSDPPTDFE